MGEWFNGDSEEVDRREQVSGGDAAVVGHLEQVNGGGIMMVSY